MIRTKSIRPMPGNVISDSEFPNGKAPLSKKSSLDQLLEVLEPRLAHHPDLVKRLTQLDPPLLHVPAVEVFCDFHNRMTELIGRTSDWNEKEKVESLDRCAALDSAFRFILDRGDVTLRSSLKKSEWQKIKSYAFDFSLGEPEAGVKKLATSKSLGFKVPIWIDSCDRPEHFSNLPPRGRAVWLWLNHRDNPKLQSQSLRQRISKCYRLPAPDSYDFIIWRYAYTLVAFSSVPPDYWDSASSSLLNKLKPITPKESFCLIVSNEYLTNRKSLLKRGVPNSELLEIEQGIPDFLYTDWANKGSIAQALVVQRVAERLKVDDKDLFKTLAHEADKCIDTLIKQRSNRLALRGEILRLQAQLQADLLFFCVLYGRIYNWKVIIKETPLLEPKVGAPLIRGKKVTNRVLCDLVDLLKRSNVRWPYDEAAKLLNLLLRRDVYPKGTHCSTDTRTSGGAVLRKDYQKLCRGK